MGDRIDCRQATEQLHDYLKREMTPGARRGDPGPPRSLQTLLQPRPVRGELPSPAGELRPPALPWHAAGPDRRPPAGRGGAGLSPPWPTAALVAAAVAALAWGLRTLTGGGALAAWLVGTVILGGRRLARRRRPRRLLRLQQPRLPLRAGRAPPRPQGQPSRRRAGAGEWRRGGARRAGRPPPARSSRSGW